MPRPHSSTVIIVVLVACVLFSLLNQPGGPVEEVTGIVQSYGFLPNDSGPPPQTATIGLSNGMTVRAKVRSGVLLQPGQISKVRVYRRVITGTKAYEVVGTQVRE